MNEQAVLDRSAVGAGRPSKVEVKFESDPGPWLFFLCPASFIATLLTLSWLSLNSF